MEKQVIYRDRQELQGTDLNNMQTWMADGLAHVVTDAITPERQFTGLAVTVKSATEIEIAPGRLVDGTSGKVFALTLAQVTSVFSMFPLSDKKWLAVSVYGQEEEAESQSRDFLIDLQTGQTQPDSVAMQRRRVAVVHIAQGLESPTPEKPEPPTGYTLIAHVRLSASGVQEVVLATNKRLPNLHQVNARLQTAEGWISSAEPRIAHIMSDIAGLGQAVSARATQAQMRAIAMETARIKERLEIPDNYIFFGADHFLDASESNPAAGGYSARLQEGLRPVVTATDTDPLALLNPLDPAVKLSADTFMMPHYTELTRLRMETQKGEVTINQYQYQTVGMVQRTMSRLRVQYGETRSYCTNSSFWSSGNYDPTSGILRLASGETWEVAPEDRQRALYNHQSVRVTQFWVSTYAEPYWDAVTTTHTINGSILAQTVLMGQTGWLTSVEIYLTYADPAGGLSLLITDASNGQPDLDHAIAKLDIAANALTTGWNKLTLARPVFVEAGKRYALALVSGSQHRVGFTEGVEYTQGVLMYRQDGSFFNEAAERDLMLRLNFAQFTTPRAVVALQPLQLAGGIGDIDMLLEAVTPQGCQLYFEYQVGGNWFPIQQGTAENLATQPALLPIRAVFVGTTDIMPGFKVSNSQVIVSKIGTSFTHFSTTRTLGTASDEIYIRLLLEDFDPTPHSIDVDLVIAGTPTNATSYHDEIVDDRSRWREFKFALGSTTSSYVIKIIGSTSNWRQSWHVAERYDLAL